MMQSFVRSTEKGGLFSILQGLKFFLYFFPVVFVSCSETPIEPGEQEPDPQAPFSFVSQLDLSGFVTDIWGYEAGGNKYAIVAGNKTKEEEGGVYIIEVTDSLNPEIVSIVKPGGYDVKVWRHYLYVSQGSNTIGAPPSQIIDISNPQAPVLVGEFPSVHNAFIDSAGYLYTTGYYSNSTIPNSTGLSVSIYDLNSSPESPELIWTAYAEDELEKPAHDISVIRDKLYIFYHNMAKVEIYDVREQSSPVFLGEYQFSPNLGVHSGWATEDDKYLYVCIEEEESMKDVVILDISNPASPFEVGNIHDELHTVHNLYIIENYAYVSFYGAGLRVYDVSNPELPVLAYEYDTNGSSEGLGAFGVYPFATSGAIYVSDVENGLFVFTENK